MEYWTPEEHERLIENMSAWMDGELPDIANTPEAGGPDDLELEVAEHQACCPGCRALFEELKELRAGFEALPEPDPPEGFAQGVMDRIRAEKKVIPLFKRPQFRALAGLAACLMLVVGIYSVSQRQNQEKMMLLNRSFQHDVLVEESVDGAGDVSARESLGGEDNSPQVNAALAGPEDGEVPQIAAYAAPSPAQSDTSAGTEGIAPEVFGSGRAEDLQKAAPNTAADGLDGTAAPPPDAVIIFERLPEGWEELFPGVASPDAMQAPIEEARAFLQLLEEQGITYEIEISDKIEILGNFDENSLCQLLLAED